MASSARGDGAFDRTVLFDRAPEAHVSDDPFIGTQLGGSFVVRRVLGEGAMGRLYEATHVRLDRQFAVKVLHRELSRREDLRARFEREARVMGRVRSDHVVDVVDVLTAPDGRTCIVTELLAGQDLEAYMASQGGRLPVGDAVYLARQCLCGLAAAHALAVVHRDIKPGNLFLARDSGGRITLKLLDFGIAKLGGDAEMTAAATVMGTPAYMAPEQARGAAKADLRSDLYAVGAVLYRALSGRAPYLEEDVQATLVRLLEHAPERLSTLAPEAPLGLVAVIERAMARDPAQRFGSADELDAALAIFDRGPSPALGRVEEKAGAELHAGAAQRSTLRARLLRPTAVLTLLAFACVTSVSGLLVATAVTRLWSSAGGLSMPERVLGLVVAGLTFALSMLHGGRALRRAYANAAEVSALSLSLRRTLLGLLGALGVWAALSLGTAVAWYGLASIALTPAGGLGLALVLLCAVLGSLLAHRT